METRPGSLKVSWPSATSSLSAMTVEEEDGGGIGAGLRAKRVKLNPSPVWKKRLCK